MPKAAGEAPRDATQDLATSLLQRSPGAATGDLRMSSSAALEQKKNLPGSSFEKPFLFTSTRRVNFLLTFSKRRHLFTFTLRGFLICSSSSGRSSRSSSRRCSATAWRRRATRSRRAVHSCVLDYVFRIKVRKNIENIFSL